MAEFENKYGSKGATGAGLGLGIAGTALGVLNGGLGGLLGGWNNGCCSESMPVNRYELGLEQTIGKLQADVALRDANIFNDQKMLEMYKYVDGELKTIRASISAQEVKNAQVEGAFAVLGEKISAQRNEFICALNRERDERCCGDNAIVNYLNATFYPKMTADVTTGTTTTAQNVYNPLPNCGCGCR
jgi:hypothetical protein